jgi:hypothetical protein
LKTIRLGIGAVFATLHRVMIGPRALKEGLPVAACGAFAPFRGKRGMKKSKTSKIRTCISRRMDRIFNPPFSDI